MTRHLLTLADLSTAEIYGLLERAKALKTEPGEYARALYEKTLLMVFEAPSLRTRLSFETAMTQLHGHAINYYTVHSPWGMGKESIEDFARTVSRYCNAVSLRIFSHDELCGFAAASAVPVINAMTNGGHPCQVLGDLFTIQERLGRVTGFSMAYLGDGCNNVTYSLMRAAARMDFDLRIACPAIKDYVPEESVLAEVGDRNVRVYEDVTEAVQGADVVYTDSWMSYRVPSSAKAARMRHLEPYRVDPWVMDRAARGAVFMHCLPAMRGMEVTADVIDGERSIVFDQAENRLHVEKAILLELLGGSRLS